MHQQRTWHTVTVQDPTTGERSTTHEKGVDQDEANQRVYERITKDDGDLPGDLLVVVD